MQYLIFVYLLGLVSGNYSHSVSSSDYDGLSLGQIIGLSVGLPVGTILVTVLLYFLCIRRGI